jgi:peptidoglycan/xylan/chitin deacetylase (PgdA/CDA1 family)
MNRRLQGGIERRHLLAGVTATALLAACSGTPPRSRASASPSAAPIPEPRRSPSTPSGPAGGSAAPRQVAAPVSVILARSHVPVLCFHQIRPWRATDSPSARTIITPPQRFADQIATLARTGYTTITPDQLLRYLQFGVRLPDRPVLLTFDDASEGQYTSGLPVLAKYRFTATFFVMTVVLDKPHWLSRDQVRDLHRRGMTIGAHTWDHHPVTGYSGADWRRQLIEPARELSHLTGAPVLFFAYPYGVWNRAALPHVASAGYQAAFQLSGAQDRSRPLLTIRRILAVSDLDGPALIRQLKHAT